MNNNEATIEQINEVIGIFMGGMYKDVNIGGRQYKRFYMPGKSGWDYCKSPLSLGYHESWDELMPVVEQIDDTVVKSQVSYNHDMMFRIEIVNGYTKIEGTHQNIFFNSCREGSMLNATYKAVYQFIQWYNQQTKPEHYEQSKTSN